MTKKCAYCGVEFEAKRDSAKFCSDNHRVMAFLKKENVGEVEPIVVVQKSQNEVLGETVADFCNKNNCTFEDLKAAFLKPQPLKKGAAEPKSAAQTPKQNSNLSFMEQRRLQKNGS